MAASYITLTYTRPDGEEVSVQIKGQDYGSDEVVSRRQQVESTMGGAIYVYDLGPEVRQLNLQFNQLDDEERMKLEWFFSFENVNLASRWFQLDLPAPVRKFLLCAGAQVSGQDVLAGAGYKAGDFVKQDVLRYHVRLVTPELSFVETVEAHYSLSISLRVLTTLPDNEC